MRDFAMIAVGLYLGFAAAVLVRYVKAPPRSFGRRWHVWGVSIGTTLLSLGWVGLMFDLDAEMVPVRWYGAPLCLAGVVLNTLALIALFRDQSKYVRSLHVLESHQGIEPPHLSRAVADAEGPPRRKRRKR